MTMYLSQLHLHPPLLPAFLNDVRFDCSGATAAYEMTRAREAGSKRLHDERRDGASPAPYACPLSRHDDEGAQRSDLMEREGSDRVRRRGREGRRPWVMEEAANVGGRPAVAS